MTTLSKREQIAAMVVQACFTNPKIEPDANMIPMAIKFADALLAELAKGEAKNGSAEGKEPRKPREWRIEFMNNQAHGGSILGAVQK